MRADDVRSADPVRHGAYLCISVPDGARPTVAAAPVSELADRLGLRNEYGSTGGDPPKAIAYLRHIDSAPGDIEDPGLLNAWMAVHVAAPSPDPVKQFCSELTSLLGPSVSARVLTGAVRPMAYTGNAMHNFSYAHRVLQQPGDVMPHGFLIPMRKTDGWWAKGWMERHTYFLPRFDDSGRMRSEGHALAAEAGIRCLLRRTYKNLAEPAPAGDYDFLTYFECTDEDVPTFNEVCKALRDVSRNPEWAFVREGPTWHGRRVAAWAELFG
jgi:hypothetical protein